MQGLNWAERRAGLGRNELTATQRCEASILTAAEREEEEEETTPNRCFAFHLPPDLISL